MAQDQNKKKEEKIKELQAFLHDLVRMLRNLNKQHHVKKYLDKIELR